MLLTNSDTKTEGTSLETYGFDIEDPGAIFGVLRSTMYSNSIESICREITCNGRDAHRELGNTDRPIEITLPTTFCSEIKFRDFGVGITPERMKSIYTKYGNSTKRDSNQQTGGFGLGAKTPFAYKPSFTITTIVPENGKNIKRIYAASVGEDRKGGVHLLYEQETNEERGTEIAIVVDNKDFDKFETGLANMIKYWDVRPIVHNAKGSFYDHLKIDTEVVLKGNDWEVVRNNNYYSYNKARLVIVDGIPYDIKLEVVFAEHPKLLKAASKTNFYLYFNTGDLDLSASREALNYVPKTINALVTKFKEIESVVEQKIQDRINEAVSYIEAVSFKNEIEREIGFSFGSSFIWKNSIVKDFELFLSKDLLNNDDFRFELYESRDNVLGFTHKKQQKFCFAKRFTYVINSDTQVSTEHVNNLLQNYNECYILTSRSKDIDGLIKTIKDKTWIDYNDLNPVKLEDFKSSTQKPKVKKPKTNAYVLVGFGSWEKKFIDFVNDSGYYTILSNKKSLIQINVGASFCTNKDSFYRLITHPDLKGELIIGIKEDQISKLGKKFKPIEDAIVQLKTKLEQEDLEDLYSCRLERQQKYYKDANEEAIVFKIIDALNLIDEPLLAASKLFEEKIEKANSIFPIYNDIGLVLGKQKDFSKVKPNKELVNLTNDFIRKYPLLKYIDSYVDKNNYKQHAKHYVDLINKELQGV